MILSEFWKRNDTIRLAVIKDLAESEITIICSSVNAKVAWGGIFLVTVYESGVVYNSSLRGTMK